MGLVGTGFLAFGLSLLAVAPRTTGETRTLADCERELAAAPESAEAAFCFCTVGQTSHREREAAERLERAIRLRREAPWGHLFLGHLRYSDHAASERLFALAAEEARRLGLPRCELEARINRSSKLRTLGRSGEAEREIRLLAEILQRGEKELEPRHRVNVWLAEASHLTASGGDLDRAFSLLEEARKVALQQGNYGQQARVLHELALTQYVAGRLKDSRATAVALAALARAHKEARKWEAYGRYLELRAFREEMADAPTPGCREKALAMARRTLELAIEAEDSDIEVLTRVILAQIGEEAEAGEHLERALALAETDAVRSFAQSFEARLLAKSDPHRAETAIEAAIDSAERSEDPRAVLYALRERMRLSWKDGSSLAAKRDSFADLAAIERMRDRQAGKRAQPGLFSVFSGHYYLIAGHFLRSYFEQGNSNDLDDAFAVSERLRSRTLSDTLGAGRSRPSGFATLAEARQGLEPGEALLSFQIAPWKDMRGDFAGGSWLLVITRAGERLYPLRHWLVERADLRSAVQRFKGLCERGDGSEEDLASELYRAFLADAIRDLPPGISRLIVIPDDALHLLSFAGLRPAPKAEPLAAHYQIESVPSSTLWLGWRRSRTEPASTPILVFANPLLPQAGRVEGELERGARVAADYRLPSLPHALKEGKAARHRLGGESQLMVGADASEAQLKRLDLRPFEILHFAAHAVLDEVEPERSAILLTPGGGKEDGLLQARDIARLDLRGKIVVLASCQSAGGQVLRGEGVQSLARAFFAAGAHTVVASLWPLYDEAGEAFFVRFYDHLGRGGSVTEAVRLAQRDKLRSDAPAFDWAGIVVLGDGGTVPFPQGRPAPPPSHWPWIVGLAVLLAVAAAGFFVLRRAARSVRSEKAAGLPSPS